MQLQDLKSKQLDFTGGAVVKSLPANAEDMAQSSDSIYSILTG